MGWPITEPIDDPKTGTPPPPKGSQPPPSPISTSLPLTLSEQGRPLPIVYGTMKTPINVIEALAPTSANPQTWIGTTVYEVGALVSNGANAYKSTANTGDKLSAVSGGPSGTGTGITDNHVTWDFVQALPYPLYSQFFLGALAEGEVQGVTSLWFDKEKTVSPGLAAIGRNMQLLKGPDALGQTVTSPFDASGYQHTALTQPFNSPGVPSGTKAELPNMAVELQGIMFGVAGNDVNPADIINDLLTHTRRGCALSSSRVDASITGAAATSYRTYCDAAGFRLSMILDTNKLALQILGDLLGATNSDAVWSQGKLKVVPLGDQAITSPAFGAVNYVPATTAVYNLGVDDFLDKNQPVQIVRRDDTDCFNSWPVEYIDRGLGYARTTVDDPDQSDIDLRGGLRRASVVALQAAFPDGTQPLMLSRILAQRSLNVRNTFRWRTNWRYCLLEPTDIVTLTEPSIGLVNTPVRITLKEEDIGRGFIWEAEDYPSGVAAAPSRTPASGDGYQPNMTGTTGALTSRVDGIRLAIAPGQVPYGAMTNPNFDNLYPNPSSEIAPPTGVVVLNDGSQPEWDYRANVGAGSYSGNWVRSITVHGSDAVVELVQRLPCAPGDRFYLEAYAKYISGTWGTSGSAHVQIRFRDSSLALTAFLESNDTTAGAWTLCSVASLAAPAGTIWVDFAVTVYSGVGGSNVLCYFDSIYARRQVSRQVLAVDALQTSNYAEDGSGIPTAGAKLDSSGTAFKCAAGSFQCGYQARIDVASGGASSVQGTAHGLTLTSGYTLPNGQIGFKLTFSQSISGAYAAVVTDAGSVAGMRAFRTYIAEYTTTYIAVGLLNPAGGDVAINSGGGTLKLNCAIIPIWS